MSFLRKIHTNSDRMLIKNGFLSVGRYYSRRSNSKYTGLLRQVVGRDDSEETLRQEIENRIYEEVGGPWELLFSNTQRNRFYLPDSIGPAWQNARSIIKGVKLHDLVDFNSKESNKLHISIEKCPMLFRKHVRKLFSPTRLLRDDTINIITLHYPKHAEVDNSAKNFVVAADKMCRQITKDQLTSWADFVNPFSGKPYLKNVESMTVDEERFRALQGKFQNQNNCLLISCDDMDGMFCGRIFTNRKINLHELKAICANESTHNLVSD